MAQWDHIETRNGSGTTPTTTSAFSGGIASGEFVVVKASTVKSVTLSIADNGGTPMTWSTVGPFDHSGEDRRVYLFWARGNGTGATTVTVSASGSTAAQVVASRHECGAGTVVLTGTPASGETSAVTSHDVSGTVTTTIASALLVCGARATASETFAAGSGYTIPTNGTTTQGMIQHRIVSSTGSYSSPFTTSSIGTLVIALAAFALEAAGPSSGWGRLLSHERNRRVRTH